MTPKFYRVTWPAQTLPDGTRDPGGFLDFPERPRARGFRTIREAMGFTGLRVVPKFHGAPQRMPVTL